MLQIAICDDDPAQLETLAAEVERYLQEQQLLAQVQRFSHPDALLQACARQRFDLYLLDIVMPMVTGLEAGQAIRRQDRTAQIIYISTEPTFALDAYAAHPVDYLVKPVNPQQLREALSLAVSRMDSDADRVIVVKTREGLCTLRLASILCCAYAHHKACYTMADGQSVETLTLQTGFARHIEPLLAEKYFLQPHAAFVVNLSRTEKLTRQGFVLQGGIQVPVSGKLYGAVRDAYFDYMLQRETR